MDVQMPREIPLGFRGLVAELEPCDLRCAVGTWASAISYQQLAECRARYSDGRWRVLVAKQSACIVALSGAKLTARIGVRVETRDGRMPVTETDRRILSIITSRHE